MKKISQIDFELYSDGEPVWARDSSHFVTERDGLITVSITGEVTTLFTFELIPEYEYVSQYRWSPDETKIAMWLWNTEQKNNVLAIFDSSSNSLTIYDIYQGGYDSMPYWSPDGRFLLINGDFMDDAQSKSGVLILDVVSNTFFRISEKSTAAGWVIMR